MITTRASAGAAAAQLPDESSDTRVPRGEAVIVDEVLPDGHGVPATAQRVGNELAVGLARTRGRRAFRWGCGAGSVDTIAVVAGFDEPGVGGHLRRGGRFWAATPAVGRPRSRTGIPAAFR